MQNSRRDPGRSNEGSAANDHFPGMRMPSSNHFLALFMLVLVPSLSLAQRDTLDLTGRWSFAVDSLHQGLPQRWYSAGLPSKLTQSVTVPHTWNSMQGLETYAGTGWYERTVTVPGSWKGKRIPLPELRANESVHVSLDQFSGDTVVATLVRPTGEVVDSWELALDRKPQ